jgi:hypothetical protein
VLLDLKGGSMAYTYNGVALGVAFSELEHGNRPTDKDLVPNKFGPNWDSGFYPAITFSAQDSVSINFGQDQMEYIPVGYISVMMFGATHNQSEGIQPLLLQQYDDKSMSFIPMQYGENSLLTLDATAGTYCSLLSSMRLSIELPYLCNTGERLNMKYATSVALQPSNWSFCVVEVDEVSRCLQIYINGIMNVNETLPFSPIMSSRDLFGFRVTPSSNLAVENEDAHVWLSNIEITNRLLQDYEIFSIMKCRIPFHKMALRYLADNMNTPNINKALRNLAASDLNIKWTVLHIITCLMIGLDDLAVRDRLLVDIFNINELAIAIHELLEQIRIGLVQGTHCGSGSVISFMERLARISELNPAKVVLMRLDGIVKLLSYVPRVPDDNKKLYSLSFWAEYCISNLSISSVIAEESENSDIDDYTSMSITIQDKSISVVDQKDIIYFGEACIPFSKDPEYPNVWLLMPTALSV